MVSCQNFVYLVLSVGVVGVNWSQLSKFGNRLY